METGTKTNANRRLLLTYFVSALLFIASILFANWQSNAQSERKDIRENGKKTTALVISRKEIQFKTPNGTVQIKPIVAPMQGTLKKYDVITVFYDKQNPKRVVLSQNDSGFNTTMWIVVAKLFVGSIIFAVLAYRKQRKLRKYSIGVEIRRQ